MANPELKPREARGLGWLWGLLALLAVVLVVWWFTAGPVDEDEPPMEAQIEQRAAESPVTEVDPEEAEPLDTAAAITAAEILDNPRVWSGISFVGPVRVTEVATPRSFWVQDPQSERDEARELLVVLDPDGGDHGFAPGDALHIEEAVVRDPSYVDSLTDEIDAATRRLVEEEPVFLSAHPTDVAPAELEATGAG